MEQTVSFPRGFYPSPTWSPPSSETDYSAGCASVFIKNEPSDHAFLACLNTRTAVPATTVTPPPGGYTQLDTYAPLTPPYSRYEQSAHSPQSAYWQTSTPPPYEDYYASDIQERKFPEVIQTPDKSLDELNDEGALEQLRAICLQQAAIDVKVACHVLNISPNPYSWDVQDVQRWLMWLIKEKKLDCAADQMHIFYKVTGSQLVAWCEKISQNSQQLHPTQRMTLEAISAHLDIWKSASQAMQQERCQMDPCIVDAQNFSQQFQQKCPVVDISPKYTGHSPIYSTDDSYSDDEESTTSSQSCSTQHIHLWQFLKELLSDPQQHGACIRWLDRGRGIFKIEDSVRVAKLWGRRKNRPAMNYDKLSRSIRQYYRKGIMKKTERSQRLVYQFCTAYAN